jgi:hypothetical protein
MRRHFDFGSRASCSPSDPTRMRELFSANDLGRTVIEAVPVNDSGMRDARTHPRHGAFAQSNQLSRSGKRRQREVSQPALSASQKLWVAAYCRKNFQGPCSPSFRNWTRLRVISCSADAVSGCAIVTVSDAAGSRNEPPVRIAKSGCPINDKGRCTLPTSCVVVHPKKDWAKPERTLRRLQRTSAQNRGLGPAVRRGGSKSFRARYKQSLFVTATVIRMRTPSHQVSPLAAIGTCWSIEYPKRLLSLI